MCSPAKRQRQPCCRASSTSACGVDRRLSCCAPAASVRVGESAAASASFRPSTCRHDAQGRGAGAGEVNRRAVQGSGAVCSAGDVEAAAQQPSQGQPPCPLDCTPHLMHPTRCIARLVHTQGMAAAHLLRVTRGLPSLPASGAAPRPADRWRSAPPGRPRRQTTASPPQAGAACRRCRCATGRAGWCGDTTAEKGRLQGSATFRWWLQKSTIFSKNEEQGSAAAVRDRPRGFE